MSAKTLPQELIEHTIDIIHLDDVDHHFLSIVSRVAKARRPRSQALIFREIIIANSLVLPGRLKTLLSRSPHLASYVQTLRLGDCGVDIVELCAICSSLTNVSELFLREIRLSSEHILRSFGEFLTSLPSLSSLSIRECTLSRTAVQVVFHSCSSLKAISFKSCKDNSKPTPLPFTTLTAPSSLRSIACDGLSAAVLDSLVISSFAPGLPTHLHLGAGINYQPTQIQLLNSVKDRVESVELLASWCWERELFLPCNRIQVLTLDIETAPVYLPEIIPSSIPTFRELRIIFTKYWGSGTSPEDVFSRRKERIEKIGTMAAQRGVQKVVWEVRLDEYDVDQTEFRGWFEGQVRVFMALPDGKCRVEFVWQDGYLSRPW